MDRFDSFDADGNDEPLPPLPEPEPDAVLEPEPEPEPPEELADVQSVRSQSAAPPRQRSSISDIFLGSSQLKPVPSYDSRINEIHLRGAFYFLDCATNLDQNS